MILILFLLATCHCARFFSEKDSIWCVSDTQREKTRWGELETFPIMSGIRCWWMGGYRKEVEVEDSWGEMIAHSKEREGGFLGCDLHNGLGALVRPLGACHVHGPD